MKEKFNIVLQNDEQIKWCNKTNALANILKNILPTILIGGFISLWATLFFGMLLFRDKWDNGPYLTPITYILPIIIILSILINFLNSKNTYFAITNKRIIKRSGIFNKNFIHYSLKNIGTIQVTGNIFDSKNSATLLITTKDFHTDTNVHNIANKLIINSLCDAYEAYNILSELTEGNNESFRVKIEK